MVRLKPYPEYKDSGLSWLGRIPAHWEVQRTRHIVDMTVSNVDKHTKEGEQPVRLCNYVDVYKNERITESVSFMRATATPEEISRFRIEPGDVLITKDSEVWNDIGIPALVEYTAEDLICGYHLALLRPQTLLSGAYLLRALQSPAVAYQFHVAANGVTRYGLSHDAIKSVLLPLPPLPEQAAIVRFLDYMGRRIQRHIRAKQKLIKLLEEQKQVITQHAVTRGIDPNVRLKSSGIDWLGGVADHWEIMPLRRVTVSRCDGPFGSGLKSSHYTDQGFRVVRLQNIGHAEFKDADAAFISPSHYATLGDHTVESADLLIAGLGDERHPAGRACVAPSFIVPAMVKADCFRFRLFRQRLDPEFAALHLTATAVVASSFLSTGATRQRINLQAMASRSIAVPPMQEQVAIVQHIKNETSSLRLAISNANREIALLREYRTRLTADVATGKLDVRNIELRALDEVEAQEDWDEDLDVEVEEIVDGEEAVDADE
jgi:type I restriction enzyme S subunit